MVPAAQAEHWPAPVEPAAALAEPAESNSFVHCCSRAQLPGVLARYFSGVAVVAVRLSAAELTAAGARVVWECGINPQTGAPASEELFPHVYGAIPGRLARELVSYPALRD